MWDDLVELMETRRQLLETTLRRHRYFADADELGSRFAEKREAAENAKDIGGIVNEIQSLEPKVIDFFSSRILQASALVASIIQMMSWLVQVKNDNTICSP